MKNPQTTLEKLLHREMTRKEFLGFSMFVMASAFGITGMLKALESHAATPTASFEPEDGTLSGGAAKATDASASGGSAVQFGASGGTSGPASWQEAVDSAVAQQDWTPIENWYAANTGHEALGYAVGDLTSGTIVSQYDGQVFEGISASVIRVSHNNVTIRGCRVSEGGQYGVYLNPTFNAPVTGLTIEYCTLVRTQPVTDSGQGHTPIFMQPALTSGTGFDVTITACNMYGWQGGLKGVNKVLGQYNWIHDFQHPPGAHAQAVWYAGSGGKAYRNYCTDGSSGCMGIYFDKDPIDTVTYEENILTGQSTPEGEGGPSYLIALKDGPNTATTHDIKIINNMFGPGYQYGYLNGAPIAWGSDGNELSGNHVLMTGQLQGNA